MAIRKWTEKRYKKGWDEEAGVIRFEKNEIYNLRLLTGYVSIAYHWCPRMKNDNKWGLFPQVCLAYDIHNERLDRDKEGECPACNLGIPAKDHALCLALDVEKLYAGEENAAEVVRPLKWGPREIGKIQNLIRLNKDRDIADPRYGRVLQVVYNPQSPDKANTYQLNLGDLLPVTIDGDHLSVRIPKTAESDFTGQSFEFELPDLESMVFFPTPADTEDKFVRMKVEEALRLMRKDNEKDGRYNQPPARKPVVEEEKDELEDSEEEEDLRRERRKKRKRIRRPVEAEESEDEPEDLEEDDPEEEEVKVQSKVRRKKSKVKRKRPWCFGQMGDPDTEDCTLCHVRNKCSEQVAA